MYDTIKLPFSVDVTSTEFARIQLDSCVPDASTDGAPDEVAGVSSYGGGG